MEELLMEELLWGTLRGTDTPDITLKLFLCIVCGGLIGLERGAKGQAAGFRTHILVCMGACIAMLTGQYIYEYFETNSDPARLGAQVISGIGFLGAGTIMSRETTRVRGLTTAAGLWAAACIGLAVGIGFFEAAIGATVVVMVTIVIFQRVDNFFYTRSPILRVYLEMESIDYVKGLIRTIDEWDARFRNGASEAQKRNAERGRDRAGGKKEHQKESGGYAGGDQQGGRSHLY